jgi:hypothetical protein
MSWIQENRFAAGLGGITAVAAAGLIFWGIKATGSYDQAKEEYTASADSVDNITKGRLYPNDANLKAKTKAVSDYEKSVADLQKAFTKFRVPTPPNVDQDVFTANLLKAKETVAKAFAEVKPQPAELPAEFSMGNESYTAKPPEKSATGILTFELDAISELMANLAAASPTKLLNIYRQPLEEETGKTFDPKGKSFRAMPIEISFTGTEATLRKFLSSLDDSGTHYYVVRSMRVINEKLKAPTAADSQFEKEGDAKPEGGAPAADPFGGAAGGFVLPGEEPAPAAGGATPPAPGGAAPAAAPSGDGVILQQVLGSEKIHVFLRIDILQFLEAKA